jgi:hypothetical protein
VEGIRYEPDELQKEVMNKRIDMAILLETRKKLKGLVELGQYILIYNGVPQDKRAVAGVPILINKKLMKSSK